MCENMTSSTNPEVHNLLRCCQSCTQPRSQVKCTENFVKFGRGFLANVLRYVRYMLSAVRLLSVCLWRWCTLLRLLNFSAFFSPYDSLGTLVLWRQKSLVGDAPFPMKFALIVNHPLSSTTISTKSAHSASTVIASEKAKKVQLALIGSRLRAFQRAIDEPCTLPLSPPMGGTKTRYRCLCE